MNDDDQPLLFDVGLGESLKADAMARVDEAADEAWKVSADSAIAAVSRQDLVFTTDEVWELLAKMGVARPREPRALGPRMRLAEMSGVIEKVPASQKTLRPIAHRRPLQVWRSKVWNGP